MSKLILHMIHLDDGEGWPNIEEFYNHSLSLVEPLFEDDGGILPTVIMLDSKGKTSTLGEAITIFNPNGPFAKNIDKILRKMIDQMDAVAVVTLHEAQEGRINIDKMPDDIADLPMEDMILDRVILAACQDANSIRLVRWPILPMPDNKRMLGNRENIGEKQISAIVGIVNLFK